MIDCNGEEIFLISALNYPTQVSKCREKYLQEIFLVPGWCYSVIHVSEFGDTYMNVHHYYANKVHDYTKTIVEKVVNIVIN